MVVLNLNAIVKFICLFQNSLTKLHLTLVHQDPNCRNSLTYIDGHRIYRDIVIQLRMMKDFSFWIETVCLCNQQMNNIIHSFQTGLQNFDDHLKDDLIYFSIEYWLTMRIGCYYDSVNHIYVIFSLPYRFDLRFVLINDTIHTHFNHSNDDLNCLIPMLYLLRCQVYSC